MKTLFLQKRGCDFRKDEYKSDCGNHRICTIDECIKGKDGNLYFLEFTLWKNRGHYRKTNKRTGEPLQKAVFEIDIKEGLYINTQFTNNNGCWGNCKLEESIYNMDLEYTKKDILKAVNVIAVEQFGKIEFID